MKETISKVKRQPSETTDKELISRIYSSIPEKQTAQSTSGQKT